MTNETSLGLSQIGQIAVNVHQLPQAVEFYRDKLGLKLLFSAGNMAFFDCNGIRLMLSPPEKPEFNHPSSIIYFKVDDIQKYFETLSARGVSFVAKPHLVARMQTYDLWMGFFHDLDNNMLALMSEAPRAADGK
jgi:catechol 2,3-dioxygenase-like lactoylglutathione lyase family enzyme